MPVLMSMRVLSLLRLLLLLLLLLLLQLLVHLGPVGRGVLAAGSAAATAFADKIQVALVDCTFTAAAATTPFPSLPFSVRVTTHLTSPGG
jgi:hypothetical protein